MTQRLMKAALIGALALVSQGAWAQAADKLAKALTSVEVTSMLTAKGYTKVHDVKFEHGVWTADARSGDGKDVDVHIDPVTGRVYGDQATSSSAKPTCAHRSPPAAMPMCTTSSSRTACGAPMPSATGRRSSCTWIRKMATW